MISELQQGFTADCADTATQLLSLNVNETTTTASSQWDER